MSNINLKKGHLLIAEPSIIGDLSFNRSIILIADHNSEGSIGFILNKPLNFTLQDLIPEIKIPFEVYNGGPRMSGHRLRHLRLARLGLEEPAEMALVAGIVCSGRRSVDGLFGCLHDARGLRWGPFPRPKQQGYLLSTTTSKFTKPFDN